MSDYFTNIFKSRAKLTGDPLPVHFAKRGTAAINANVELELCDPRVFPLMPKMVEDGVVSAERFEEAVKQNLRMKGRLGLLDKNPKLYDDGEIDLDKEEYRQVAYDLATDSVGRIAEE